MWWKAILGVAAVVAVMMAAVDPAAATPVSEPAPASVVAGVDR